MTSKTYDETSPDRPITPDYRGARRGASIPSGIQGSTSTPSANSSRASAFQGVITADPAYLRVIEQAAAIAPTQWPLLINGETGVGKEVLARAIHKASGRSGPLVAVNVAGLDDTAFSNTLFGHEKGAYTGATESCRGLVESAQEGALLLDEIGDLSSPGQLKLLRLVEQAEYYPIGAFTPRPARCRLLFSTNQDLVERIAQGAFRKDLFHRIRFHQLTIPPLRDRPSDIPLLTRHFLESAAECLGKKVPSVPSELLDLLAAYDFPGNVRELESMVFEAMSHHNSGVLSTHVFHVRIEARWQNSRGLEFPGDALDCAQVLSRVKRLPRLQECTEMLIDEAMRRANHNQSIAAKMLGISQPALSRRLKGRRDEPR